MNFANPGKFINVEVEGYSLLRKDLNKAEMSIWVTNNQSTEKTY